jgi:uncharacterized protein (DUF697 family)
MSWLDRLAEIRSRDWSEAEPDERRSKAREVIQISSYAAAAAAVVPVPMAELALLLPIHTAMVMTVGHVFGRPVSRTEAARVAVELGAIAGLTMAGTAALSALRKILLPGVGGVLAAPASFALTWGLGKASIEYFENPDWSRERLRVVFAEAMAEGRKLFSKERLDDFRARYGEGEDVAEQARTSNVDSAGEPEAPAPGDTPSGEAPRVEDGEVVSDEARAGRPSGRADRDGGERPRRKRNL